MQKDLLLKILVQTAGANASLKDLNKVLAQVSNGVLSIGKNHQFYKKGVSGSIAADKAFAEVGKVLTVQLKTQEAAIRAVESSKRRQAVATKSLEATEKKEVVTKKSMARVSRETEAALEAEGSAAQVLRARLVALTQGQYLLTQSGKLVNATTGQSVKIQEVAAAAASRLAMEQQQLRAEYEKATAGMDAAHVQVLNQQMSMNGLAHATGSASFAVLSLGQGFADAGQFGMGMAQGIRAVTNNAQQAFQSFMMLSAMTGGVAAGFKALWAAMMGPAGLILAFGAVTATIEFLSNMSQRASKDVKTLADSLNELFSAQSPDGLQLSSAGLEMVAGAWQNLADKQGEAIDRIIGNIEASVKAQADTLRASGDYAAAAEIEIQARGRLINANRSVIKSLRDLQEAHELTAEEQRAAAKDARDLENAYFEFIGSQGVDGIIQALAAQTRAFKEANAIVKEAKMIVDAGFGSHSEFTAAYRDFVATLTAANPNVDDTAKGFTNLSISVEEFAKLSADGRLDEFLKEERWKVTEKWLDKVREASDDLQKSWEKLLGPDKRMTIADRAAPLPRDEKGRVTGPERLEMSDGMQAIISDQERYIDAQNKIIDSNQRFRESMAQLGTDLIVSAAQIGGGLGGLQRVFGSFLSKYGAELIKMGLSTITLGVTLKGVKEALKTLNPAVAIAAGAALVAAGARLRAQGRSSASALSGRGVGSIDASRSYVTGGGFATMTSGGMTNVLFPNRGFGSGGYFSPIVQPGFGSGAMGGMKIQLVASGRDLVGVVDSELYATGRSKASTPFVAVGSGVVSGGGRYTGDILI